MNAQVDLIPEGAPFEAEQRAWLNGLISALAGWEGSLGGAHAQEKPKETFPWHDPNMKMDERMDLAEGKPHERRLMAAMAQLDCGQCGYLCKTYAEAIAFKGEDLNRCVPGAKETERKLKELVGARNAARSSADAKPAPAPQPKPKGPLGSRDNPYRARLESSTPLNKEGSTRDTRHVVIELGDSDITYRPGDSIGIYPENDPKIVEAILEALNVSGGETVRAPDGEDKLLRQVLLKELDITKPADECLACLADAATDADEAEDLAMLSRSGAEEGQGLLELLRVYPTARPELQSLVSGLAKLQPRLYSISSSPRQYPTQIHTTVAVLKTAIYGRGYKGVASTFLAKRLNRGGEVPIYLQRSEGFRLSEDADAPAIMIGPGTGIAPFLSFLQEREARGDAGRNWLFFGNPNSATDYIYQEQTEGWRKSGLLARLTLAFSRDQGEKVYVQHRMLENAEDLWLWLEAGAVIYVCGDAERMAKDVDQALHRIVAEQGALSEAKAAAYVKRLSEQGRYLRDVY